TALGLDEEVLRAYGNLTVHGDAHVMGRGSFTGDGAQTLHVDGNLELGGSALSKSTTGSFTVEAQHIDLTAPIAQTISNDGGQLLVGGALVKGRFYDKDGDGTLDPNDPNSPSEVGQRSLTLLGVSEDANAPPVKGN